MISILIVSVLIPYACGQGCAPPVPSDIYPELVDPADTIFVRADSTFRIVLETNPSTGYTWSLQSLTDSIVALEGEPVYVSDPCTAGLLGAGGREVWSFSAISTGEGRIVFGLNPPGDVPGPVEIRQFDISIY